jgi:hypothetical protein
LNFGSDGLGFEEILDGLLGSFSFVDFLRWEKNECF